MLCVVICKQLKACSLQIEIPLLQGEIVKVAVDVKM